MKHAEITKLFADCTRSLARHGVDIDQLEPPDLGYSTSDSWMVTFSFKDPNSIRSIVFEDIRNLNRVVFVGQ